MKTVAEVFASEFIWADPKGQYKEMAVSPPRDRDREALQKATEAYLKDGGSIETIPMGDTVFQPKRAMTVRRRWASGN